MLPSATTKLARNAVIFAHGGGIVVFSLNQPMIDGASAAPAPDVRLAFEVQALTLAAA